VKTSWAVTLASAIMLALGAVPASAQANRTWVSGTGTDSGTCTIAAPCASFQYALSQTKAGGEIDCLTPGDFGGSSHSLTIGQSVSIVCDGVSNGGILTTSNNAITINAGTMVYLAGLDLNGPGYGQIGVQVSSGSTVYITHSSIRGFVYGVVVQTPTNTRVVIKDSIIVNNSDAGLYTAALTGGNNAAATVNTVIDDNGIDANADISFGAPSAIALIKSLLTGSPTGLYLQQNATGDLIGPSNTIAGQIIGSPTSVPFK
jgi:hypothetical protein